MLTYVDPSVAAAAGWQHGRLLLRFLRVRNAKLPLTIFLLVGLDHRVPTTPLIWGAVLIVLVYGFVVVFNDIHDVVGDKINNRDLPLATGELTDAQAIGILGSLALGIVLLVLAWSSAIVAMATAALTMASYLYSAPPWRLSDRGLLGPA
ncbi:MAG: UbiA family prenyltransferase, partial [Acidimicrobiales bacterium]|nr:UbiA family prenyltransferase [Acidimicrobiales bacterium]